MLSTYMVIAQPDHKILVFFYGFPYSSMVVQTGNGKKPGNPNIEWMDGYYSHLYTFVKVVYLHTYTYKSPCEITLNPLSSLILKN